MFIRWTCIRIPQPSAISFVVCLQYKKSLSSSLLLFVMWRQHHNTESIRLLLTTFRFESFNTDYSTAKSVRSFMISVTILLDGRAYIHECDLSLCSYFMARLFLLVSRHTGITNSIQTHCRMLACSTIRAADENSATIQSFSFLQQHSHLFLEFSIKNLHCCSHQWPWLASSALPS